MLMTRTAKFDPTELYRYRLRREWHPGKPTVTFLMLNPSTADANIEDPTVRRCIQYAIDWGYGALEVVNIFALRSTDPAGLKAVADPIGPDNDQAILDAYRASEMTVAAWGSHGAYLNRGRQVFDLVTRNAGPLYHLTLTKAHQPGHPLYLKKDLKPQTLVTVGEPLIKRITDF